MGYLVIIIGIAVAIGFSKKDTYTNALDDMDKLDVSLSCQLDKDRIEGLCELISDESQYVFKVKVLEEPVFDFQTVTHKVKILEVDDSNYHAKLSIKGFSYRKNYKKRRMIKETSHGFSTLESKLNDWIYEKDKEISNKIKKI